MGLVKVRMSGIKAESQKELQEKRHTRRTSGYLFPTTGNNLWEYKEVPIDDHLHYN